MSSATSPFRDIFAVITLEVCAMLWSHQAESRWDSCADLSLAPRWQSTAQTLRMPRLGAVRACPAGCGEQGLSHGGFASLGFSHAASRAAVPRTSHGDGARTAQPQALEEPPWVPEAPANFVPSRQKGQAWAESGASRCPSLGVCAARLAPSRLGTGAAVSFHIAATLTF